MGINGQLVKLDLIIMAVKLADDNHFALNLVSTPKEPDDYYQAFTNLASFYWLQLGWGTKGSNPGPQARFLRHNINAVTLTSSSLDNGVRSEQIG